MSEVVIKPRDNGPYKVTGPIILADVDGNRWEVEGESIALCRCGHSGSKPFCDGAHHKIGFAATERAPGVQQEPT